MTVRGDAHSEQGTTSRRTVRRNLTWLIPAGGTLIAVLSLLALSPPGQFVLIGQLTTPTLQIVAVVAGATCFGALVLLLSHRLGRRTDHLLAHLALTLLRIVVVLAWVFVLAGGLYLGAFASGNSYTSIGVIGGRDLLISESAWFHTRESLVERHGLLIASVAGGEGTLTRGTPVADGDYTVQTSGGVTVIRYGLHPGAPADGEIRFDSR